ncbi:MAG: hypothetical protein NC390_00135 [Fusobacterium sp.]|nr:hypothetical protein [Fusobacterium sp.]
MLIVLGVSQTCFGETLSAVQTAAAPENSELISAIIKFATVMFAVMLSSFAIFLGLSIWNAILRRSRTKTIDYEATLKSPQSVDEAILLFIQKNKLK